MKHYNQPELFVEILESTRVLNETAFNGSVGDIDTGVDVGGEE